MGDMLSYICEPRPWVKQVIAISHNAKAFGLHIILNRAVFLKWKHEVVMSAEKIIMMMVEHMYFIYSICFLPFRLRKLFSAFGLTASKAWYPR